MENLTIDDQIEYREIKGMKALYYKLQYPNAKVKENPYFEKWLNSQKNINGNNGIISFCKNCDLFFYFKNAPKEKYTICCSYNSLGEFDSYGHVCEYCGQIYFEDSLCCTKNGIKVACQKVLLNGQYFNSFRNWIKFFPFIFLFAFSMIFLWGLFFYRRMKYKNDIFSSFIRIETTYTIIVMLFSLFLIIIYSLIFSISYILFFIIYLIYALIYNIFII